MARKPQPIQRTAPAGEKEALMVHLGASLRQMRLDRNLQQVALAKAARISRPMLSSYEWGRAMVTLPTLLRVLDAMGETLVTLHRYMRHRQAFEEGTLELPASPEEIQLDLSHAFSRWIRSVALYTDSKSVDALEARVEAGFANLSEELRRFVAQYRRASDGQ